MGYIEDIQKINSLAKELMEHGMATSLDEAVIKAKSMLKNDVPLGKVPNPGDTAEEEIKVEEINSQTLQEHERKLKAVEDKKEPDMTWQEAMTKNNEYMVGMLKQFESALNMFNNEMSAIKRQISDIKESQKVVNVVTEAAAPAQQPQTQQTQQVPQQTGQSHPKTGSSDPSKFSVEDIFYCGNK
ncbi:MAG: hypothetical protein U9R08_02175 [Nanoarchaeota archaeon]|nr:hypothetical protein [Nanoarchaeota archaeon]